MLRNLRPEKPSLLTQALLYTLAAGGAVLDRFGPRPFAAVGKLVGLASGRNRLCSAEVSPGVWFTFDVGDFYWNRLAYDGFDYEPELRKLLELFRDIPFTFLDCGANFGFWSVLVASKGLGGHRVLAVEASPRTIEGLKRNVAAYPGTVTVFGNAISEKSGESVTLFERGSHAGASLQQQWLGNERPLSGTFTVETISVDDLVGRATPPVDGPILIKLDVEGVEVAALKGAGRTLSGDSLVIFEEYGEDRECAVAAFVLSDLNVEVFFMSDEGKLERIHTVDQVRRLKRHARRGYNFLATREGTSFHSMLTRTLTSAQSPS